MEQPVKQNGDGISVDVQCLAKNLAANEAYIQRHYPEEIFIAHISQLKTMSKYAKGLIIPDNVKVAESRLPINAEQRRILRKELRQAGVLARFGYSVFLTPEYGAYKIRVTDAVVNGVPFEFRNITGQARKIEIRFGKAKEKGYDVNVFLNIDANIEIKEAKRRISLVLAHHLDYTGKIIISFKGKTVLFLDTGVFR